MGFLAPTQPVLAGEAGTAATPHIAQASQQHPGVHSVLKATAMWCSDEPELTKQGLFPFSMRRLKEEHFIQDL